MSVVDSYFAGKAAREESTEQNSQTNEMPISLVINQGDEDIMKNITLRKDGRYMGRKQIDGERIYAYGENIAECVKNLKKAIKNFRTSPKKQKPTTDYTNGWIIGSELTKSLLLDTKAVKILQILFVK